MKTSKNKKSNQIIKVLTKDKKQLEISKSAAMRSTLLAKQMEENENPNEPLQLQEVEDKIIDKLWEYLEKVDEIEIKEVEKPLTSNDMKNETDDWSANFVDIPLEDLVNLTKGASYMGIRTLVDLCCAKLASMCMDKSEEEINKNKNNEASKINEKDIEKKEEIILLNKNSDKVSNKKYTNKSPENKILSY